MNLKNWSYVIMYIITSTLFVCFNFWNLYYINTITFIMGTFGVDYFKKCPLYCPYTYRAWRLYYGKNKYKALVYYGLVITIHMGCIICFLIEQF